MKLIGKILKIVGYTFGGILIILGLLILFTQTGMFKRMLSSNLSSILSKQINGELIITSVEGNLFENAQINKIKLIKNDSSIISIDHINFEYSLNPLLNRQVRLHSLLIDSIHVEANQTQDSSWNLQQILISRQEEKKKAGKPWEILLDNVEISNVSAHIQPIDTSGYLPKEITAHIIGAFELYPDSIMIGLQQLSLYTSHPEFPGISIKGKMQKRNTQISWNDLILSFDQTRISSHGITATKDTFQIHGDLNIDPLDMEQTSRLLFLQKQKKSRIKFYGSPQIGISVNYKQKRHYLNIKINDEKAKLNSTIQNGDNLKMELDR